MRIGITIPCENENIHTDHKEHLVYYEDNNNGTNYKEEVKQFIEKAHEYLTANGLNNKFDQKRYIRSPFSINLQEITLEFIKKEEAAYNKNTSNCNKR